MDEDSKTPGDEEFSSDPNEDIEMENQFLKLKLMAERGASFHSGDSEVPPAVMNEWLKNVEAFEANYEKEGVRPLREILGHPGFKPSCDLDDDQFGEAYKMVRDLLDKHHIDVSFGRPRDDRFKYDFITGELMDHETSVYPGMTTGIIYEEFHPDHALDIERRTNDFLNGFFERWIAESNAIVLGDHFIRPDGIVWSREELVDHIKKMYELVPEFENCNFHIENIDFTLDSENGEQPEESGMGYSEGELDYVLVLEDGERKKMQGPFKIYLQLQWGWWSICFFYLPGFNFFPKEE